MQDTVATALSVGFDPIHPMRAKEAVILPRPRSAELRFPSPDFYSREPKGVEVSGASLRSSTDPGRAATVFLPTDGSNIHALFLINSPRAATTDRLAEEIPRTYVTHFNTDTYEDLHSLPGLGAHTARTIQHTLEQTLDGQPATCAFAHVVPKNGSISHAVIGLQEGTLAVMTYHDEKNSSVRTSVFTPQALGPANEQGMHIGAIPLLTGAKLVLTTDLAAYQQQHGLEELTLFYELSEQIRSAIRTGKNEVFSSLPPETLEHLMFSLSPLSLDRRFQQLVKRSSDMATAAALAGYGLAHLAKDSRANYDIPERIAFIGSRVPRKETTKRRIAA